LYELGNENETKQSLLSHTAISSSTKDEFLNNISAIIHSNKNDGKKKRRIKVLKIDLSAKTTDMELEKQDSCLSPTSIKREELRQLRTKMLSGLRSRQNEYSY
jgi:hypothetical protein